MLLDRHGLVSGRLATALLKNVRGYAGSPLRGAESRLGLVGQLIGFIASTGPIRELLLGVQRVPLGREMHGEYCRPYAGIATGRRWYS